MNNEGILSFYIGIISIKTVERSDFHHSSFFIRQSSFQIVNRHSSFQIVIPFGFQPKAQIPQVPPSNPMVTVSPSIITGTLRAPLECFNMVSRCLASLTTL